MIGALGMVFLLEFLYLFVEGVLMYLHPDHVPFAFGR